MGPTESERSNLDGMRSVELFAGGLTRSSVTAYYEP